jgi:hypothetical protein
MTRMLPNAFEIGVNSLLEHPECGFAYGICKFVQADGSPFDSEPTLSEKPLKAPTLMRYCCAGDASFHQVQ